MKKDNSDNFTPMMKQYQEIKSRNPGHILFYRLGDFYVMFFDDAKTASKVLNITLTTRGKHLGIEIPLAGFPHHQINSYLSKMVKAGYKVAVCDQTENPKYAKGIVKRDITEIITAGTALSEEIIEKNTNNYIAAIYRKNNTRFGFSAADISTGEFLACDPENETELKEIIMLFNPSEILVSTNEQALFESGKSTITKIEDCKFLSGGAAEILKKHFKISSISSFGFKEEDIAVTCAEVLLEYLSENIKSGFTHLDKLKKYNDKNICVIDYRTRKNLEITEPVNSDGNKDATLYSVMNKTKTPMGARLLRKWLTQPLRDKIEINNRLEITEKLLKETYQRKKITALLSEIADIERLSGKISANRIRPDELIRLKNSLLLIPELKKHLSEIVSPYIKQLYESFVCNQSCIEFIENSIIETDGLNLKEKRFIKSGYSKELDELYEIIDHGKEKLLELSDSVK
ncbi:MAG: DNA mismatch repair protein MutS, partial [Candidatus Delongbacteria bacterium]|nr:DNA mismatch repair protein MutS [Candidatus Delongbacteria bacterium]